jgi:hypothetical protein
MPRFVLPIAAVLLIGAPSTALAEDLAHSIDVTPRYPRPGQAVSLHASIQDVPIQGTALYSWDLDADGICETEWTTNPDATVTYDSAGQHFFTSCLKDDSGSIAYCKPDVIVYPTGPLPRFRLTDEFSPPLRALLKKGLTLRGRWNRPVTAGWVATLSMNTQGDAYNEDHPLALTTRKRGKFTEIKIVRTPNWAVLLKAFRSEQRAAYAADPDNVSAPSLMLRPDLSTDPVFAPVAPWASESFLQLDYASEWRPPKT